MKNFTRLFIFVLALTTLAASYSFAAKRLVLVEEATNASCGPCALYNPDFQKWVESNLDIVIPVTIHSSWPGATDPMYMDDKTMSEKRVQTYYGINGVPNAHVNGLPKGTSPSNEGVAPIPSYLQQLLDSYKDTESPITLNMTETKSGTHVTIKVDVKSTNELIGKTLRVYAVELEHHYDKPGNNGETDFKWIAKKMLPDYNGTTIDLGANQGGTYTLEYDISSKWNADKMYSVAFIQDDDTHEVLQAATTAKFLNSSLTVSDPFTKIPRNGEMSSTISVKNLSDTKATFNMSYDTKNSFLPTGWSATFNPTSLTLDPGASQDVTVTIKSAAKADFIALDIKAAPVAVPKYFALTGEGYLYSLTEDTKYVVWSGTNQLAGYYTQAIASTPYNNDFATIPYAVATAYAYPPSSFDINMFSVWSYQPGSANLIDVNVANGIKAAINAGKDVFVMSDISGWFATYQDQNNQFQYIRDLYKNYFEVSLPNQNPTLRYTVANNQATLTQFTIKGVAGDSVANSITATANTNAQSGYDVFTDILAIPSGSAAKAIFYYDNDKNQIGGVRLQKESSKIVFTTFGIEAIADQTTRTKIVKNILDWFAAADTPAKLGPVIAVSAATINFDSVEVGKTKDIDITVTNTGDEDLVVNQVYNDEAFDEAGVFSVVSGDKGLPITIKPNQGSLKITVRFTPKEVKDYTEGYLVIKSNNKDGDEQDIELNGIGKEKVVSVNEDNTSANGLLTVNAWPNVFATTTNVTVTVGGQKTRNVELTVIDETGRTVASLANEAMNPGQYVKEFNAGSLASGTYYILARTEGTAVRIPVVLNK